MSKITKIWAREILDSRAIPTVEVMAQTESGFVAVSSVPSGASTGAHEAVELRDNDKERFGGFGVLKAVENINKILGPQVLGMDVLDLFAIDKKLINLDGTENKGKFGANAILAISEVVVKLGASDGKLTLYSWINELAKKLGIKTSIKIPVPLFNMINGGKHGAGNLDFQEFFIIPVSSKTYSQGLEAGVEIYHAIKANLERKGAIHSVGDEGGFAPNLFTNADALELFVESVKETKYEMGRDVFLGLDVAADSFYKDGSYQIRDKSSPLDDDGLLEYYRGVNNQYHLAVLEDPFFEDGWGSWQKLTAEFGNQIAIVGDDLLATNPKRVQKAITEKACNTILIKPNQIGTILETLSVIKMAKEANWKVIVSHRSGETNDTFIADFAVGVGADYVKFGAPARGERVAKYNRLSSIENETH
ncbi:MAG: phosphopyruvate hydratase [Candidatus Woesebacteria bacterium]|nr:phosphopyruvate hydratase [Candidatus Woesebacteria bacterium]